MPTTHKQESHHNGEDDNHADDGMRPERGLSTVNLGIFAFVRFGMAMLAASLALVLLLLLVLVLLLFPMLMLPMLMLLLLLRLCTTSPAVPTLTVLTVVLLPPLLGLFLSFASFSRVCCRPRRPANSDSAFAR